MEKTLIMFADYTTHIISTLDTTKNNLASQIEETQLSAKDYCNSINLKINKTISQQTLNFWKFSHFKQLHQLTSKKTSRSHRWRTPKLESAPTYKIYKKLSSTVFALRRLRQITNKDITITAYHALFASQIRYGIITSGKQLQILWSNSKPFLCFACTSKKLCNLSY